MNRIVLKDIFKYSAIALFLSTTLTACGSDDRPINTPVLEDNGTGDSGSDNSGNATEPVVDTTPPVITLKGGAYEKRATSNVSSAFYTDEGATATDDVDGDLTPYINVSGVDFVDLLTPGTYPITYNVSDDAGNAATEVTRTVRVANYGDKDTSFNSSGAVFTDTAYASGKKVLQDSLGNVYAIGQHITSVFVRKFSSTGAIDTTYATSGGYTYGGESGTIRVIDALIDSSDNIILAVRNFATGGKVQLIKLKPDATLDSSFGTNGVADTVSEVNYSKGGNAITTDSQGNIYVVGYAGFSSYQPYISKFNATGSQDSHFGNNGNYTIPATESTIALDIAVTPDDNLVVVGHTDTKDGDSTMKVWQVSASGSLDTDFGNNGVVAYDAISFANGGYGKSITVDSEGNIIAAGEGVVSASQRDVIIMKLASDGSFDPDFPTATKFTNVDTDVVNIVRDVAVGDDGIIYIAGGAGTTVGENEQDRGYVVAFSATGTTAYHFGNGLGRVEYDMIQDKPDSFISLLFDETNYHILLLGFANNGTTNADNTAFVFKLQN